MVRVLCDFDNIFFIFRRRICTAAPLFYGVRPVISCFHLTVVVVRKRLILNCEQTGRALCEFHLLSFRDVNKSNIFYLIRH